MFNALVWIVKQLTRIITLINLKRRGWKWFFLGVFGMFIVPMILKACL